MRTWRTVLGAGLLCAFSVAALAGAEERDEPVLFNKAEGAEVSERMGRDARIERSLKACPADALESERPFWRRFIAAREPSEKVCARHPLDCYDLCVRWSNSKACFDLALAFDHHSLDVNIFDKHKLFAFACATGMPGGCTNRAAGIRNGRYRDDPFRETPLASRQACEFRSFELDCDRRGAWGCAMLGQAYEYGEGVGANAARARAAFEASCTISPKFAACAFAKRHLERLNAPARPPAIDEGEDESD